MKFEEGIAVHFWGDCFFKSLNVQFFSVVEELFKELTGKVDIVKPRNKILPCSTKNYVIICTLQEYQVNFLCWVFVV